MRARVIINKGNGSVQGPGPQFRPAELADLFARHGVDASIVLSTGQEIEREAQAAIGEAATGRFDAIIVGGGDGSVGTVAGVLAGSGRPLGVLPLGTLNHFAKDLGLPLDIDGAVAVIAAGCIRPVDVAEVNGRVFVNNSSVGLYADMVADRERQQTDSGRGKWPAMLVAAWKVLRRFPVRRVSIHAEGWSQPCQTPFVFVGNNVYTINLFNPGGRIALDRGELCLYVLTHRSPRGLLWLSVRATLWRLDQDRDFEMRSVREVEILSRARRLRVSVDGEVTTLRPPLVYRIRPKALDVFAPATGQEEKQALQSHVLGFGLRWASPAVAQLSNIKGLWVPMSRPLRC